MHAHRQRREKTTKNVYSTSVGSAALPGSEASNYTYTKVHEKINHYNKAEKTRETLIRQRSKKTEERECNSAREQEKRREETRERALGGPALMTVAAATSLAAGTNQRPSRGDVAHGPALRARATLSPEKHVPGCEGSAALL